MSTVGEEDATFIERAWLAAGKAGNVARMRELRLLHPKWLDLGRAAEMHSTDTSTTTSNWEGFRLGSIGASALHAAAWGGDVEVVRFLLEAGQHPDTRDRWGMTPTMVAIMRLYFVTMRCVFRGRRAIQRNLVVDCRDEDAETVDRTLTLIKLCQSFGSDLDARNSDGKTALHIAGFDDAYVVAKHLLDAGASIDVADNSGQTALHLCINAKSLLVTNLLIDRGASIDIEDANGVTPLSFVVKQGLTLQLQLVLNHYALVSTASRQDFAASVLLDAVDTDAADIVSFLLENRYASVDSRDNSGETAMHRAVLVRNLEMMRLLHNMDIDREGVAARTPRGDSCLHYAARHARSREAAFLVDTYCPQTASSRGLLDWTNDRGETALFTAGMSPCAPELEYERSATISTLSQAGASLFTSGSLKWRMSEATDRVFLPPPARQCLCQWIAFRKPSAKFCYDWVASVDWTSLGQAQARPPLASATVVTALLEVGFELEAARLLVLLPLQRAAVETRFLPSLRAFSEQAESHVLLHQLVDSLAAAWRTLEAARRSAEDEGVTTLAQAGC